jgi:hypothetical protein
MGELGDGGVHGGLVGGWEYSHILAAGGRVKEESSFFEKKNQKTFAICVCHFALREHAGIASRSKSFLVLFFKKERFLLLR